MKTRTHRRPAGPSRLLRIALATATCAAPVLLASAPARAQSATQKAETSVYGMLLYENGLNQEIQGGWTIGRDVGGDKGLVWHDADTAESLLAYYEATGDAQFNDTVESYYGVNPMDPFTFYTTFGSIYNDDVLWWALTFLRAYDDGLTNTQLSANSSWYLSESETIFNYVCTQWGYHWNQESGTNGCSGLPQLPESSTSTGGSLPTITNELLFQTAAKLALRAPSNAGCPSGVAPPGFANTYEGWASAMNSWFQVYYGSVLGQSLIPDGLDSSCTPAGSTWTYNQGPILGALLDMATLATNDSSLGSPDQYLGQAFAIAEVAMAQLQQQGVLTEWDDFGTADDCLDGSESTNGDCPAFKGIFVRYLSHLLKNASQTAPGYGAFYSQATALLNASASSIWQNQSGYPNTAYLPEKWTTVQVVPNLPNQGPGSIQTSWTSAIDGLVAPLITPPYRTVTGISPSTGPLAGGNTATIQGYGFDASTFFLIDGSLAMPVGGVCTSSTSCAVIVPASPQAAVCNQNNPSQTVTVEMFSPTAASAVQYVYNEDLACAGVQCPGQPAGYIFDTSGQCTYPGAPCSGGVINTSGQCVGVAVSCGTNEIIMNDGTCAAVGSPCAVNGDAGGVWTSDGQCNIFLTCPPGEQSYGSPLVGQYCAASPGTGSSGGGSGSGSGSSSGGKPVTGTGGVVVGGGGGSAGGGTGGLGGICKSCPKMQ